MVETNSGHGAARRQRRVGVLTSVHPALDTRVFHKEARTLAAAGYRVQLVGQHERDCLVDGVEVHALPASESRLRRPLLWWLLLLEALRMRADIYHIHDPELLPLALVLQTLSGKPVIYDVHEYYGDEVRTRQWIPAPLRTSASWLTDRMEKAIARRLGAVVTVNEHMNARFLRLQPRSIAVYNYPPAEYFAQPLQAAREPLVVYTGVMTRDRGLEIVYHSGQILKQRFPGLEIAIAGVIDWSGLAADIPRDTAAWQREAGVRFLGVIPQTDVPGLLARASVGWIPFLPTPNNIRSTPNKLLEYMAAALPVVASDFGYMRTIVQDAGCGLLAAASDPQAHAEQIAWLLDHAEMAQRMGVRGRAAVLDHYTWAAEGEKLVCLYDELTGVHRTDPSLLSESRR
jgi:glycosyltransferase involved in cell wall biosynthesis